MDIVFIGRQGVDLYSTLIASETSRAVLKFYHPSRLSYGILITTASLGSAISLVSELRWYIRRYVSDVLFEISDKNVYCTHALAREFYERDIPFMKSWKFRRLCGIRDGGVVCSLMMEPRSSPGDYLDRIKADEVLEIWCTEEECIEEVVSTPLEE